MPQTFVYPHEITPFGLQKRIEEMAGNGKALERTIRTLLTEVRSAARMYGADYYLCEIACYGAPENVARVDFQLYIKNQHAI